MTGLRNDGKNGGARNFSGPAAQSGKGNYISSFRAVRAAS